jgi:hypothetical protein
MSDGMEFIRGQVSERRRASSILLSPAARGREREAIELTLNSTLSVGAAVKTLIELAEIDAERAAPGPTVKRK